jgi:glycerol-3-phosphate dehydrogenase (NAD(P)+)
MLPHQIVAEELGEGVPCGALTGPSFAEEVARGLPTAITLAAADGGLRRNHRAGSAHARLRVYANHDVSSAPKSAAR